MTARPNPFARQHRAAVRWGRGEEPTVLDALHHFPSLVSPETPAAEARLVAVRAGVHHLPVASERGEPLGVVCRCALTAAPEGHRVEDCMRAPAVFVESAARLTEATRLMLARGVGCLPVVYEGAVVGVLTRADLVEAGVLSARAAPQCAECGTFDHVGEAGGVGLWLCRRCAEGKIPARPMRHDDDELAFGD